MHIDICQLLFYDGVAKKSPGWHRGERCNLKRRRKDKPKQSVKAIPAVSELPPALKGIPVTQIELRDLPSIASEPLQIQVLCPRCGHEITRQIKYECTPIPESFRPFYERAHEGDLEALVEYYKESWWRADLGSAFYQCLGYFAAKSFPKHVKIVEAILRINKTGKPPRPRKLATYRHWYETFFKTEARRAVYRQRNQALVDPAHDIRDWLRDRRRQLRARGETETRPQLWLAYIAQTLPGLEASKARADDYHSGLKDLFSLLAKTQPRLSPSQAARKVACKIARISESSVSHFPPATKNVRK